MFSNKFRWLKLGAGVVTALVIGTLLFGAVTAQDIALINYGTAVVGTIPAGGTQASYAFNGTVGHLVTVRVTDVTPAANYTVSLVGPAGQVLTTNDDTPFVPTSTSVELTYRLQATGTHQVMVTGTEGQFLFTLEARPTMFSTTLNLNTPVSLAFPFDVNQPAQLFVFNTDPTVATSILIDAEPFNLDAYIEIRDTTGQLVSIMQGGLDNACVSFGLGDELQEVMVTGSATSIGTLNVTLSNAPCELGDVVAAPPVTTPQFVPVVIDGACAASSFQNVNIRSGPSVAFGVIGFLPAGQGLPVIGRNDTGLWLAVTTPFGQGWVSATVVAITGAPCTSLATLPTLPTPVASATPGLPLATATTSPEATSESTVEATDEATPEVTVPPETTPEATTSP